MHEIGLCEGLLDAVERRAAGRRVARVTVRIGVLHRVAEPALDQAFALLAEGTVADGAAVDLVTIPVRAVCRSCGQETVAQEAVAVCPSCGSTELELAAGDELLLESIQLEGS